MNLFTRDTSASAATAELPEPGRWTIDTAHSSISFWTRHLGVAKVRGRFAGFEGDVVIDEDPTRSSVEVTIDAASIDTNQPDRDDHLRADDFLDVERYPTLTFRSTRVDGGGADWQVAGELTIRGVTREVVLDTSLDGVATDPAGRRLAVFHATTEIDREDFGLTWNQLLESGGLLVGKRVTIELDVELVSVD